MTILEFTLALWNAFCFNMNGKMKGMFSLSTSPELNTNCIKKHGIKSLICAHCFAFRMLYRLSNLSKKLARNTALLTGQIIPVEAIPVIYGYLYGRFESFGDLNNDIQFINYCNIARKNSHIKWALWTKNPWIIRKVWKENPDIIPDNLTIIYSSPAVNKAITLEDIKKVFPFVDKVFTVYDKKTVKKMGININCGSRSCLGVCGCKCYDKHNGFTDVREQMK